MQVSPEANKFELLVHALKVKVQGNGKCLTKGWELAAGHNLYAKTIPIKKHTFIETEIAIAIPKKTYTCIALRSGLAAKNIHVGAGVVDADYRGTLKVILLNLSEKDFKIKVHHWIAQLIVEQIDMSEIKEVQDLNETKQGSKGLGSTVISQPNDYKKIHILSCPSTRSPDQAKEGKNWIGTTSIPWTGQWIKQMANNTNNGWVESYLCSFVHKTRKSEIDKDLIECVKKADEATTILMLQELQALPW